MTDQEREAILKYYYEQVSVLEIRDKLDWEKADSKALAITAHKYGFPASKMREILGLSV